MMMAAGLTALCTGLQLLICRALSSVQPVGWKLTMMIVREILILYQ